jgi:hypothetical protein
MIHSTVLNPEDIHLVEQPNARSNKLGVHREICSQLHGMLSSAGYNSAISIGTTLGLARRAHMSVMIIYRTPAKSADMKENRSQCKHEHLRQNLSE